MDCRHHVVAAILHPAVPAEPPLGRCRPPMLLAGNLRRRCQSLSPRGWTPYLSHSRSNGCRPGFDSYCTTSHTPASVVSFGPMAIGRHHWPHCDTALTLAVLRHHAVASSLALPPYTPLVIFTRFLILPPPLLLAPIAASSPPAPSVGATSRWPNA
jgi:hypothetical protein